MIVDTERNLLHYPGALVAVTDPSSWSSPTNPRPLAAWGGYTVRIPILSASTPGNFRWARVIEEVESVTNSDFENPFLITKLGVVALRINYPYQSSSMTGFQTQSDPFAPNIGHPSVADDSSLAASNPSDLPGTLSPTLGSGGKYAGTYGGEYSLGEQSALGSQQLTGGLPVRPFRRVVTGQAIYRREIFQ